MNYTTDAYLITCITNMHVGTGGANYGVVDNLVQRDTNTNVPTINSSSLKGALREFFKNEWGENDDKLNYVFGPDSNRNSSIKGEENIGHYKFFNADLLVLPARSNKNPFYRVTANMLIDPINSKSMAFRDAELIANRYDYAQPTVKDENAKVEDWQANSDSNLKVNEHMGNDVAVFDKNTFKKLLKRLPVIARNQLENGESKNLWYEEVVPRESRFIFFVSKTGEHADEFDKALQKNVVQIGANTSIGYGYCTIKKITGNER